MTEILEQVESESGGEYGEEALTQSLGHPTDVAEHPTQEDSAVQEPASDWESRYKELQSTYTKSQQSLKDLEAFKSNVQAQFKTLGGPENAIKWMNYVLQDQDFTELISRKQRGEVVDTSDMDESQKQAIDTVEKIAAQKAREMVSTQVQPYIEHMKAQQINEHFKKMDSIDPSWHSYREDMAALLNQLPPSVREMPSFDDIEDLYWRAVRRRGDFDTKLATIANKKVQEKKGKSTPRTTPQNSTQTTTPAKTIAEALLRGEQKLGLRLT